MDFPGKSCNDQISDLCKQICCKQKGFSYYNNIFISTGHTAQYCTYTTMENESKDIISVVTVDKRQTSNNSVIMENHAVIQTFDSLLEDLNIKQTICIKPLVISVLPR